MVQKRVLRSFNAGEVSPDLYGRDDIPKVNGGMKVCENMILTIQGAAYYRGGMKYAHATKNNTGVLLRDFSYNDNDCYTMELGDHYMRFYRDQKLMVDANNQPLELVTPYAAADLFDEDGKPAISKAQSADLIYLFQNGGKYPVQRLERNANGSFTLQAVDYAEDGGFEDINMDKTKRVYVSAQTGDNITITATHSIFKSGHVGDIFYVEPINFDGIYTWAEGKSVTAGQRIISNYKTYTAEAAGTTGYSTPKHQEGTATDGAVRWIYEDCGYGIAKILTVAADGKSCTAKVLLPFPYACTGSGRNTWKWKFGSWCAQYGYPTTGCFHRERLCVARGSRMWFSWSDDFESFAEKDGGQITSECGWGFGVSSGITVGNIAWMQSGRDLLLGTDVNVVGVGESSSDALFYSSNCRSYEQTREGCAAIQPVRIGSRFVFMDITGKNMDTLAYDANTYQYNSDTIQTYAKHINVEGVIDIVRIRDPFDVIYCLKSNGELSCSLYSPTQEGLAWYRIKTDGDVLSICKDGNNLAMCVCRKKIVNNQEVNGYGVEYLQNPFQGFFSKTVADFATEAEYQQYCIDSLLEVQKEACYLDGSIIISSDTAFSTINTNLDHLAGRTVSIVSEGGIEPSQEVKLVNGRWTVQLKWPSKIAIVGLPYKGVIIPTSMEGDGETSARGRIKRINAVGFRVCNSMGGMAGDKMDNLKDILSRSGKDNLNNPIPLFTGDVPLAMFSGDYEEAEQLIFIQPYPLPFMLQAIVFEFEIS